MKKLILFMVALAGAGGLISPAFAAQDSDTSSQIEALQSRVTELENELKHQNYQERNKELMSEMIAEMGEAPISQSADSSMTAGHDGRFFIKTADDQFRLSFDTLLQFRHTFLRSDDGNDKLGRDGTRDTIDIMDDGFGGFDITINEDALTNGVDATASAFEAERMYLFLRGHVLKDINYVIQISGNDDNGTGLNLYRYEVAYDLMDSLGFKAGRYKGPFGKQESTAAGSLMMIDRSLANEVFNIGRSNGVELYGMWDMGDVKPEYRVMVFNGFRDDDDIPFQDNDNSPGFAGRIAVPLMGASMADFANESDLVYHDNMVGLVGFSLAYENNNESGHFAHTGDASDYEFLGKSAHRDGGTGVYQLGGEATMLGMDVSMKYMGLSVICEGFYQHIRADDNNLSAGDDFGFGARAASGIDGRKVDNFGFYTQAGYFIVPNKFEIAGRIGAVLVDDATDSWEYTLGWNYYIHGQDLKLSMDVGYIDRLPIESDNTNFLGVQNQSLLSVRSQLQFQF